MQQVNSYSVLSFVISCCGLCYCIECVSVSLCVTFVCCCKNGSVCVTFVCYYKTIVCVSVLKLYHLCVWFWDCIIFVSGFETVICVSSFGASELLFTFFLIEPCWHEKVWFCKMSEGRNLWAVFKTHHNAETSLGCKLRLNQPGLVDTFPGMTCFMCQMEHPTAP